MTRVMKDSGIEWIGDIPKSWNVCYLGKAGLFSSSGIDKKIEDGQKLVSIINYTDVYKNKTHILSASNYMTVSATNEQIKKHCVSEGDLIFTPSSETVEDIGISALVNEPLYNTAFSYHVIRFQFKSDFYKSYKKYLCNNDFVLSYFSSRATGTTRQTLSRKDFKECLILIPSIQEQQQIADYLDEKCGKIDKAVEAQKEIIAKLKEYKQSLITETVCRGLNKSTPLKDSGIEWIGKIPENWKTTKMAVLFKERKCKNKGNTETNVLSLSYGNIKKRNVENNMGLLPESFETYNIIVPGNIVLRLTDLQNDHKSLRCGFVKEKGIITSAYITLEKIVEVNCNYYYKLLHTFDILKGFYNMGDGVRQNLKYNGELNKLLLPVPPLPEQEEIANYLDKKCENIDLAIKQKEQSIEKLMEYKKSLIFEYVTGKKEVV